jgi:hypothetical protein
MLLQRAALRRKMGAAARASVGREFTLEDMVARTAKIYARN